MAGIGHRGFMGRNKGVIPVPQAGVCTPYPVPIPITSGLLSYVSIFNSCDQYQVSDGTSPLTASGQGVAYVTDISGNGNDVYSTNSVPSTARSAQYIEDGVGDVRWYRVLIGGTAATWGVNDSWRLNADVKTVIILCKTPDISNNVSTRLGFHYSNGMLRFNTSRLQLTGGGQMTNIIASNNTWMVVSCRCNNNVVLGIDKTFETVSASAPPISNTDFRLFTPNQANNGGWGGDGNGIREIAIYSGSLSDTDLETMVDYMKAKWNL